MAKLPPYGRTIDNSQKPIWLFIGYQSQALPYLKHYSPNTCGLFLWDDPRNYRWPVRGRDVVIFCWLSPEDDYIEKVVLKILIEGAIRCAVYQVQTHEQITYLRD